MTTANGYDSVINDEVDDIGWTISGKKRNNKINTLPTTCKCRKHHMIYCHNMVHRESILAGVSSVIIKSKFKDNFNPIFGDLNVKLSPENILSCIIKSISSTDLEIKKCLELIKKITWITKVIEHYTEINNITNSRASIKMIEYWIGHISELGDNPTTSMFINIFDDRYKKSIEFNEQKFTPKNSLSAYLPIKQIELDFDEMPTVFDSKSNNNRREYHYSREPRQEREQLREPRQEREQLREPRQEREQLREPRQEREQLREPRQESRPPRDIKPKSIQVSTIETEDEFKIKQFEGEIQHDYWSIFTLWSKFIYKNDADLIETFTKDFKTGSVRRTLLRLIHPDKISHELDATKRLELQNRAKTVGHELESKLVDFEDNFKKYSENITNIPRWLETFKYVTRTSLSHTSANRTAFHNRIDDEIIKLVIDKIQKEKKKINILVALNTIILWSHTFKNGKYHGELKTISKIVNDILELNRKSHNSVPNELVEYIFGTNTGDYWDPNEIIDSVPSLKYKFGQMSQDIFEAYFGKNILCITSPMLRDFILRMIRSNFGTSGSSNELIEYSYNLGVRMKYINPDNKDDSAKHMITYILVRTAFLAVYEKCETDPFTLSRRSNTLSFAKIKGFLWEDTQYQQFIQEYNMYQKQIKINFIFGKIRRVFDKHRVTRINHLVRIFCNKLIKARNLRNRDITIFNAGMRRIIALRNKLNNNSSVVIESPEDELDDWELEIEDGTLDRALVAHYSSYQLSLINNNKSYTESRIFEVGVLGGNTRNIELKKYTLNRENIHREQSAKYMANNNYMKACQHADEQGISPPQFDADKEYKIVIDNQRINFGRRMMIRLKQRETIADLLGVKDDKIPEQNTDETIEQFYSRLTRYERWVFKTITVQLIDEMNENRLTRIKSMGWTNFKMYDNNPPSINPPIEFWAKYNPEYVIRYSTRINKCNSFTKALEFYKNLKGGTKIENDEHITQFYMNLKRMFPDSPLVKPNNCKQFNNAYTNTDSTPTMPVYNADESMKIFEAKVRAFNRQSVIYDDKSRKDYLNTLITIRRKKICDEN